MIRRHTELSYFVINEEDTEINALLLNAANQRRVDKPVKQVSELDTVTKNYSVSMQSFVVHELILKLCWRNISTVPVILVLMQKLYIICTFSGQFPSYKGVTRGF